MEKVPQKRSVSQELKDLFDADQADRITLRDKGDDTEFRKRMIESDSIRLKRGKEICKEYKLGRIELTSEELVQLAYLFQHSGEVDDYKIAHDLATDAGEEGKWLSAAAEDRWLLAKGEKQKWGTQFIGNEQAPMLSDEESGVTDEMRRERRIPARADQLATYLNRYK
jgi:hypothetical protein